ncbi:MAG: ABC transporter substrate-binding protein [Chitinophagales bacterium]|nr:ABC transporter substrate-binding protein [Chitinophagales bacterium]
MPQFTDQTGYTISLSHVPKRIVSLVPSQTELLYDLGLDECVVGITKFCVHPKTWFRSKQRVGGTKTVKLDAVEALQPDLILANKEENIQEQVEALRNIAPVWTSDISNLAETLDMIQAVGALTDTAATATTILEQINNSFAALSGTTQRKAAYLIWRDPYMTAGGDTFISDMLQYCCCTNVFAHQQRYPAITLEDIRNSGADTVLLSSEPFPFKEKHIAEISAELPGVQVLLVDGEMFSWYGSRLLHAPAYFHVLREQLGLRAT